MRSRRLLIAGVGSVAILLAFAVGWYRNQLFSSASVPRIQSLAVLPLQNLSGDPKEEYFADGMTEALTTNLARIAALKVISRTSAMRYKAGNKSPQEIAAFRLMLER